MKVRILGCGTSGGVPRVGNVWGNCDPKNPKNRRRRVSVMVEEGDSRLIVDTSPDLREQLLDAHIDALTGVLYTHDHADHTHGIDDLRGIFHCNGRQEIPIYGNAETLKVLKNRFDYVFTSKQGYPAICKANEIVAGQGFKVGEIDVLSFNQIHGPIKSLGFRFGKVAYSTDISEMTEEGFKALEGIDTWIVDALRYKAHPTHSHLEKTLSWIEKIKPKRAILTHMTWEMDYETLKTTLPKGVEPAFDGMEITFN